MFGNGGDADGRKPPARAIEETIGYLLRQACKAYRVEFRAALAGSALHVGQDMALLELWKRDGLGLGELAERLFLEPSTVTRMVRRMEEAGFVRRRRDARDARVYRVYLTEEGRALEGMVNDHFGGIERKALAGLSAEEKDLLRRVLPRVHANLLGTSPRV